MSNLQSKLGDGLSKLQGGIEQGKAKLQVVQEVTKLKKTAKDSSAEKSKLLLNLGNLAYQWVREGKIKDSAFLEISNAIVELDHTIYSSLKKISQLEEKSEDNRLCECGAAIMATDKFCGDCGRKVAIEEAATSIEMINCFVCQEEVPSISHFCGCCGSKLVD